MNRLLLLFALFLEKIKINDFQHFPFSINSQITLQDSTVNTHELTSKQSSCKMPWGQKKYIITLAKNQRKAKYDSTPSRKRVKVVHLGQTPQALRTVLSFGAHWKLCLHWLSSYHLYHAIGRGKWLRDFFLRKTKVKSFNSEVWLVLTED